MKKVAMPLLIITLFSVLLVAEALSNENVKAFIMDRLLTQGTASFSVRTATYNGPYAPRNAGVIWVTDSNNQFVKTIKVWASNYRYTLIRWIANSSQNMTGAITSASLNSHQLHNVQWNGNNWQNNPMPDGDYKFNIEFTEHNASASNLGKYKQVSFTKSSVPVDLVIPNESFFRDMHLTWQPTITVGTISGTVSTGSASPISGAVVIAGDQVATTNAAGDYSLELVPGQYTVTCSATGYTAYTQDNVSVALGQVTNLDIALSAVSNADPDIAPSAIQLLAPYPNPAKNSSSIRFKTDPFSFYELSVYNNRGQLVRSYSGRTAGENWNELVWDGNDSAMRSSPSGLYFVRLRCGDRQQVQRVILSR